MIETYTLSYCFAGFAGLFVVIMCICLSFKYIRRCLFICYIYNIVVSFEYVEAVVIKDFFRNSFINFRKFIGTLLNHYLDVSSFIFRFI